MADIEGNYTNERINFSPKVSLDVIFMHSSLLENDCVIH